jgi:hypothetical protein
MDVEGNLKLKQYIRLNNREESVGNNELPIVNLRRWFNQRYAHKGNRVKFKQNDHHTTKQRKERHQPPSSVDDKSSRSQQLGDRAI